MAVSTRPSRHVAVLVSVLIGASVAVAGDHPPASASATSPAAPGAPGAPVAAAPAVDLAAAYGRLPIRFEANVGQTDQRVQFISRSDRSTLFLTAGGAVVSLRGSGERAAAIRLALAGADHGAPVEGVNPQPGTTNYFIDDDPAAWRTGVGSFGGVRYRGVYPGIDLLYHGNNGKLEYDFEVAPGADPGAISVVAHGADSVELDAGGDIVMRVGEAIVRQHRPVAYQSIGSERRLVEAGYVRSASGHIQFALGTYDQTRPLVIDPVLEYASYLGGTSNDGGNDAVSLGTDIAIDASGAAYITGETNSIDFPTTVGAYDTTDKPGVDVFVTKLNPAGTAIVYSTYLGSSGTGADGGYAIAVDQAGSAYVTGYAGSTFPITAGVVDTVAGNFEPFVTKLNPAGSALVYSTYLGGASIDRGYDITVDGAGNAFVAGQTYSTDFDTTTGAYDEDYNGGSGDAFVAKLNPTATALVWSTFLGGSDAENPFGVSLAVDADDNVYIAGETNSTDFPVTVGAWDTTHNGGVYDVYVASLAPDGSNLRYATYLGGSSSDREPAVAVDGLSAVVAGTTSSSNFPTTAGAYDPSDNAGNDGFVTKLTESGSGLLWSTYLGGSNLDEANDVGLDQDGNVYVAGYTVASFPVTPGAHQTSGSFDAFMAKLNPGGASLLYATYYGGSGTDKARAMAVSSLGDVYLAGTTRSTDLPTTTGAYDRSHNGGTVDLFVTKFNHIPFTDVLGTTFARDIIWLYDAEITSGCSPTLYCPLSPVTRGQMASFLARALALPPTGTDYFTDDDGTTHEQNINRLAAAGITAGCTPTTFCPNANVSRAQMASFLVRALGLSAGGSTNYFTDDNGNTHEADINRLRHAGLTTGCSPTTYCPTANVTRGQMAAFLHRAFEKG